MKIEKLSAAKRVADAFHYSSLSIHSPPPLMNPPPPLKITASHSHNNRQTESVGNNMEMYASVEFVDTWRLFLHTISCFLCAL